MYNIKIKEILVIKLIKTSSYRALINNERDNSAKNGRFSVNRAVMVLLSVCTFLQDSLSPMPSFSM